MRSRAPIALISAVCLLFQVSASRDELEMHDLDGSWESSCPHLTPAFPNHDHDPNILVPYRLVRTDDHGVGVFVLRKVHRGEPVLRFRSGSAYLVLTKQNWPRVLRQAAAQGFWGNDPQFAKAFSALMVDGKLPAGSAANRLMTLLIKRDFGWAHGDDYIIPASDERFVNSAPLRGSGHVKARRERLRRKRAPVLSGIEKDALDIGKQFRDEHGVDLALHDVEPCTELFEDYGQQDVMGEEPDWFQDLRKRWGVEEIEWDESETEDEANLVWKGD